MHEKIDEALINYANYAIASKKAIWETPTERSTNFDIGIPYKTNFLGAGDYNLYEFKYEGATGYYQVFGDKSAMIGKFEWMKDAYSENKHFGANLKKGYNSQIYVDKEPKLKIITLVFPSLESKTVFRNKYNKEFFSK